MFSALKVSYFIFAEDFSSAYRFFKVMKSKRSYYETAKDEVDLLECIREADSHEGRQKN